MEGVQFHPESILTQHGHEMLANFLRQHVRCSRRRPETRQGNGVFDESDEGLKWERRSRRVEALQRTIELREIFYDEMLI